MRQAAHGTGWGRQAAALASAVALIFHVVVMALAAGRGPDIDHALSRVHAHHPQQTTDRGTEAPKEGTTHKAPCCILSLCPGLPGPPSDYICAFLPEPPASQFVFETSQAPEPYHDRHFHPVGARAPPVPV